MSVLAPGVRDRSFKTVFRGYDRASVRAALDAAVKALEALEADVARLREQQADAMREMDRIIVPVLNRNQHQGSAIADNDLGIAGADRRALMLQHDGRFGIGADIDDQVVENCALAAGAEDVQQHGLVQLDASRH